jgi:uncharacterized protein (DUF1778 family)
MNTPLRDVKVTIRLRADEAELLHRAADVELRTISDLLREASLDRAARLLARRLSAAPAELVIEADSGGER